MIPSRSILKLLHFYFLNFLLGFCVLWISSNSFILKSSQFFALSDQQYGYSFLPIAIFSVLTTIFYKRLLDFFGIKFIYSSGIALSLLYVVLLACITLLDLNAEMTFAFLSMANFFFGIGFALLMTTLNILTVDLFPENRERVLTGFHASFGIGASLCPVIMSYLFEKNLWRISPLALLAGFVLILLISHKLNVTQDHKVDKGSANSLSGSRKSLPLVAYGFAFCLLLYGIVEASVTNWSIIYLTQEKEILVQESAICLSLFWLCLTLGRIFVALMTSYFNLRILFICSPMIVLVGLSLLFFMMDLKWIFLSYMVMGVGCSYFFPITMSLATYAYDEHRDMMSSYIVAGLMMGIGIGSSLLGVMRQQWDFPIKFTFLLAIVCMVLLIALTMRTSRLLGKKT